MLTKLSTALLGLALILGQSTLCMAQSSKTTLDVWPGPAPGEIGTVGTEKATTSTRPDGTTATTSVTNVSKPTLLVCRPEAAKNKGVAVLVFPGGGYNNLAWDKEGEQVAGWLNSIGATAAVLKYRVPRREGAPKDQPPVQALMDAQRAISLVRSKATEWGIDAKRIGVLGFSAGGHLAAWSATNSDKRAYDKIDATDDASCRPDFAVMIYPGGVIKRGASELAPEIRVTAQTPPCFLVHAGDDSSDNQRGIVLGSEACGGPGGVAHLRLRRPRLRPASHGQALRHLAPAVRGVVAGHERSQGRWKAVGDLLLQKRNGRGYFQTSPSLALMAAMTGRTISHDLYRDQQREANDRDAKKRQADQRIDEFRDDPINRVPPMHVQSRHVSLLELPNQDRRDISHRRHQAPATTDRCKAKAHCRLASPARRDSAGLVPRPRTEPLPTHRGAGPWRRRIPHR